MFDNTRVQRSVLFLRTKTNALNALQVKVGYSFVFLDARKPDCMLKECNLGNVVTDAFVFHYANQTASDAQWTNASIAIQNSGSITSSIAVSAQGTRERFVS